MNNSDNSRFNRSESTSEFKSTHSSESIDTDSSYRNFNNDFDSQNEPYRSSEHTQMIKVNEQDARLMSMLIYLLSLFTSFIGPLVIWLLKRNESKLVDQAGKSYFNYYISYFIYSIVGVILVYFSIFLTAFNEEISIIQVIAIVCCVIIIIALFVLSILSFIFTIIGCIKYMSGKVYKIPLSFSFFQISHYLLQPFVTNIYVFSINHILNYKNHALYKYCYKL